MLTHSTFQVPPFTQRKRIPMRTIRALAKWIAVQFNPEQIILFGSHAYGKPTACSDVDLLIVMDSPSGWISSLVRAQSCRNANNLAIGS